MSKSKVSKRFPLNFFGIIPKGKDTTIKGYPKPSTIWLPRNSSKTKNRLDLSPAGPSFRDALPIPFEKERKSLSGILLTYKKHANVMYVPCKLKGRGQGAVGDTMVLLLANCVEGDSKTCT